MSAERPQVLVDYAFNAADAHKSRAAELRGEANRRVAAAIKHERWERKWRAWATDRTGTVTYPGRQGT